MKRLIERKEDGSMAWFSDNESVAEIVGKLAAYEDTGLEPEEVAALVSKRTCSAIEREGNFFTEGGEVDQEGFCQWLECSQCGRTIGRDARYCPGCGAKIIREGWQQR